MNDPLSSGFWRGKRVLVTGHTGFKGSWLCTWLLRLGAEVFGYSLPPPTRPALFDLIELERDLDHAVGDVCNGEVLRARVAHVRPDIVFHLAAQPIVREAYRDPTTTFATNVSGTVHLLEAVRACPSVRVVCVITTDKVYENREWVWGYREDDALGGFDPYSASKACTELLVQSWRRSFFSEKNVALASARAGNVIGGGDWASDRLVPDAMRAFSAGEAVSIRNPSHTRPWQHVLEPLAGYLLLAQACWSNSSLAQAYNLGPRDEDVVAVREVMNRAVRWWGEGAHWVDLSEQFRDAPHEAGLLKLDVSLAAQVLGWRPRTDLDWCLEHTVAWYRAHHDGASAVELRRLVETQIDAFTALRPPTRIS